MQEFLLDQEGDLDFTGGDFNIGNSDAQHQEHILVAHKGEYKQFPELGVGITQILNDDEYMGTLIEIKKNLEYDGMHVKNVKFMPNGNLYIDGNYKK
ncbi:oxidase [Flavobacterium covae]|uniref:Oxidase n=1 Tax=Flavobacterium covae TaxID=2906076 RepID=A0ABW8PJX0_9FLAO|nr:MULTISPECIES: oxidase [Flavobacterium]OWP80715.1 oxidase [Flavobacterium covae]POR21314.1 oxidase [Flavobacterium columnare]